ncbi:Cytoplasmic FMR1-interacting protein 2 [Phytophthora pseudosyringae]|uniref:Cytoplasmic FMR1-interacting protein 2 n=1 Tax=Phytophthora pseudosyringae TaxID=221518 RepID=A0A8T1W4T0_9STRA|nr:Cytoplasmic FMR1-interacting protein 2 [Phytophthora pseudosyringae]
MEVAGGSSIGALRTFAASCCPQDGRKTGGGCCADALTFSVSPPPASDEFSHEVAAGFLFAEEMKIVRQLQAKCKEGRELIKVIYCSRSCARAFPPGVVADQADPKKTKQYHYAIYTGGVAVEHYTMLMLQPQMEKIKQLNAYCSQAVVLLSDNIQRTTVHENMTRVIPDVMMDALVDIMDVILQLNHLHDTKSSLRNDFSVFKRVFLHIKDDLPDADLVEKDIVRLQEFMGSSYQAKGSVWDSLRHNLTNVKRYDQVTYLLLRHCVIHIENDACMTPSSKFKYIRALSYLIAVLEGSDTWKKTNTLPGADKKVIEAAVKLIARFPVIPMFHETSIKPVRAFQSQGGTYKLEAVNGVAPLKNRDIMFDVVAASRDCKATCEAYLPRLMHAVNMGADQEYTQEQIDALYEVLVDGISHLSKWKSSFLLFLAWKYENPRTNEVLRATGIPMDSPFLEYERVTKHNYSDEEWLAMADIIYGVKSVVQILRESQLILAKCVRRKVYQQIQVFVQHTLLPILHRADKRKLGCTKLLHDIRAMCGDWVDSELLMSDFKKKRKERKFSQIPDRTASAPLCQIQMLRTAIDSMFAKRSMGDLNTKSTTSSILFSFKKDLDSSDAETLQEFYRKAGAFPVLLDLSATLNELGDFSHLWFRELYVELVKSVQIPAEISLPWLLVEHCLDGNTSRVEPVLAILDAYNDAGNCSLYDLQQQHLYDETEAEGKLCFDHFVFLLADRVYLHCKTLAAKNACREWIRDGSAQVNSLAPKNAPAIKLNSTLLALTKVFDAEEDDSKYKRILTQRHVSLFGRSYDLTFQLGQRVDALLGKDLEAWFTKFEASDATCYVAMLDMLKILKTTHASLSALGLVEFDDVLGETNDETVGCLLEHSTYVENAVRSRVHEQILQSILSDLCQHFSLKFDERRLIRMQLHEALTMTVGDQFAHEECLRKAKKHGLSRGSVFRSKIGNSAAAKAAKYGALEKAITGTHRVFFGEPHVEALCELLSQRELVDVANDCINFAVAKIEDVLALCIPALGSTIPPFRLPRFMYRTEGCYGYFEGKYKHLLDSDELEAQIFHCFREIGNALMFLLVLGSVLDTKAIQLKATQQPDHLGYPNGRHPHLFQCALERIDSMLEMSGIASEWEAAPDSQPEKMPNASSFYHVWCALEFLSCNPPRGCIGDSMMDDSAPLSLRGMFGDGVQFAGCTLVHLLGQRTLYDLWNVSQHVINVHHYEEVKAASDVQIALVSSKQGRQKGESCSVQTTVGTLDREMADKAAHFVVNAREMRATSKQVFHTLETAWPSGKRKPATFTPPSFTPPVKTPSSPLATHAQYLR